MFDILGSLLPVIKTNRITLTTDSSGLTNLNVKMYSIDSGFDEIDPAISGARVSSTGEVVETGDSFGIMQAMRIALIVTMSEEAKNVTEQELRGSSFSVDKFQQLNERQGLDGKIYAFDLPARKDIDVSLDGQENISASPDGEVIRQNSGTDIAARYLINFDIPSLPTTVDYLHIKAFCYVDSEQLFNVFPELGLVGFPVESDSITETGEFLVNTIRGPGVEDLVILNGRVNPASFILTREDGTPYNGAYHYHLPTDSYMVGSFHRPELHDKLIKVQVRNDKVQDFRSRSRIEPDPYNFHNFRTFLNSFDSIANESFKILKTKVKLRQKTTDSFELNNTSIETDLSVDNLVTGEIKIDQVEIMREHSAFGFMFDGLQSRQKLYSLWWRDMFKLVDVKLVRRRLSNNFIGHNRLGLPDRKLFDPNQIEETIVSSGEPANSAFFRGATDPNFTDNIDYYDINSFVDSNRTNPNAQSDYDAVVNSRIINERELDEAEDLLRRQVIEKNILIERLVSARTRRDVRSVTRLRGEITDLNEEMNSLRSRISIIKNTIFVFERRRKELIGTLPSGMIRDRNWITEGKDYKVELQNLPVYAADPNDPSEILFPWVRNLVFEDYTFKRNPGLTGVFQYGVELTYEDGLVKYIYETIDNLTRQKSILTEISTALQDKFNIVGVGNRDIKEGTSYKSEFLEYINDNLDRILQMISAYVDSFALVLSFTATQDFDTIMRYLDRFEQGATASGLGMGRSPIEQGVINFLYSYLEGNLERDLDPSAIKATHINLILNTVFNTNNGAMSPANIENFRIFESHYDLLIKNLLEISDFASNSFSITNTFTKTSNAGRTPSLIKVKKYFKEITGGEPLVADDIFDAAIAPISPVDTEGIIDLRVPTKARSSVLPGVTNPFLNGYFSNELTTLLNQEIQKFEPDTSDEQISILSEENAFFTPFEWFGSSMFSFGNITDRSFNLDIASKTKKLFLLDAVIENRTFSREGLENIQQFTDEQVEEHSLRIVEDSRNLSGIATQIALARSSEENEAEVSIRQIRSEIDDCTLLSRNSTDALIDAQRRIESSARAETARQAFLDLQRQLERAARSNQGSIIIDSSVPEDHSLSRTSLGSMEMFTVNKLEESPPSLIVKLPWQLTTAIEKRDTMLGVSENGRLSKSVFGNIVSLQRQVGYKTDEFGTPKLDKPIYKSVKIGEVRAGLQPGRYRTLPFESPECGIVNNKKVFNIETTFKIKANTSQQTPRATDLNEGENQTSRAVDPAQESQRFASSIDSNFQLNQDTSTSSALSDRFRTFRGGFYSNY